MSNVFLLHCSISVSTRQSAQIKIADLQLPEAVVDSLQKQQSIPIRSVLSSKLKEHLGELRTMQRSLYDECCIHNGDIHFLHENYFSDAMRRIDTIRIKAKEFNEQLQEEWSEEYEKWSNAVDGFVTPLFSGDPEGLKIAKEAYLSIFPTRQEFEEPIKVFVVGPNPVSLDISENVDDHNISTEIQQASAANTSEVLEAAQHSAGDRAMTTAAELLDDLDTRITSKISNKQTGGKRRGSWELAALNLRRISTYCPDFTNIAELADELLEIGGRLQNPIYGGNSKVLKEYSELKQKIRAELKSIVERRDSSEGLNALKKSLALSSTYKDLVSKIQSSESKESLDSLQLEIQSELSIYKQRSKHLQSLFDRQNELFVARETVDADLTEIITNETPDF